MKSVLIYINTLKTETVKKMNTNPDTAGYVTDDEYYPDEVRYSELPGALMLGVDGHLKPIYHGPDNKIDSQDCVDQLSPVKGIHP